jgi:GDP-D-mannose dehydratase
MKRALITGVTGQEASYLTATVPLRDGVEQTRARTLTSRGATERWTQLTGCTR